MDVSLTPVSRRIRTAFVDFPRPKTGAGEALCRTALGPYPFSKKEQDMKKLLAAGAVVGFALLGSGMAPASAAPPGGQICPACDSGKIDVVGEV
jgi:hypothetical protein